MHELYSHSAYTIKRRLSAADSVGISNNYDVFTSSGTETPIAIVSENSNVLARLLRLVLPKAWLPCYVKVSSISDKTLLFTLGRWPYLFTTCMSVRDAEGKLLYNFSTRVWAYSGCFRISKADKVCYAEVKTSSRKLSDYQLCAFGEDKSEFARITWRFGESLKTASKKSQNADISKLDLPLMVGINIMTGTRSFSLRMNSPYGKDPEKVRMALASTIAAAILTERERV